MTETFLADPTEAQAIHRIMFDYFWAKWRCARKELEASRWAALSSPHPDSTQLR